MRTLGINCGHDSSLALAEDGKIVFAIEEERLTGNKKMFGFPGQSLAYLFRIYGIGFDDFDRVAFSQILNPIGRPLSFVEPKTNFIFPNAEFLDHHYCHAVSAYAWSGWDECVVMTLDGGGDNLFATIYDGKDGVLTKRAECEHLTKMSFGMFYNFVTECCGFTANRHEGKVMGLAARGEANGMFDGIFWVDGDQINSIGPGHKYIIEQNPVVDRIQEYHKKTSRENVAASCQKTFEDIVLRWVRNNAKGKKLAVAGGSFANVLCNMKIAQEVEKLFVVPPMFDNGGAVGAALYGDKIKPYRPPDMYFGFEQPVRSNHTYPAKHVAKMISEGKIVGLVQGRMEFGPRALGNRSILADARDPSMNQRLNERLSRSEFMPFAPAILSEYAEEILEGYDQGIDNAPFMTNCWKVREMWSEKIPSVVHVDGTVRPQVVSRDTNPYYWEIIKEFMDLTGVPLIINTSFNTHEAPIICFRQEGHWALWANQIDVLVEN